MPGRRRSPSSVAGLLLLLVAVTACVAATRAEALAFDSKKLESSSQLWSGYHPNINTLTTAFEDAAPHNLTTLVGDSAFLPCAVLHLGDRSVTWMRKRDLHILTAGIYTYSADERFMVLHPENSNDWTLHIKFVTVRDAGVYECQVNSDPKISRTVILNVIENQLDDPGPYGFAVTDTRFLDYMFNYDDLQKAYKKNKRNKVPVVLIEGPQERHIQRGSILGITCVVRHAPQEAPENIFWFHGAASIDYDSPRGGVSIQTEKSLTKTVSKLMLSAVGPGDTGTYSCSPTALAPAEIIVHVQNGQNQQPVKQGIGFNKATRIAFSNRSFLLLTILVQLYNSKRYLSD